MPRTGSPTASTRSAATGCGCSCWWRTGPSGRRPFVGDGCAISTASASLLTEAARGLPEEEALELVENFRGMVAGESEPDGESLGKLTVFAGVRDYPTRVKCATLAWHTLRAAIEQSGETVKTE